MNRRAFLSALGGSILARPLAAEAQQPRVYKVGYIDINPARFARYDFFRQAILELGWVEGKNITFEYRPGQGKSDEAITALAAELTQLGVDVIVTMGNRGILAAKRGSPRVPIVMVWSTDPVGNGFIESLARPGGTITGLTFDAGLEIAGKRVQLLAELIPGLSRVVNLWDPRDPGIDRFWPEVRRAASTLGVVAESVEVRSEQDLEKGLAIARKRQDTIFLWSGPFLNEHTKTICAFAVQNRLPVMVIAARFVADDGCLISYATGANELFRRAATFVDKVLKGAKPGDLPIEQPTKQELAINLKTAKAIGLTIPQSILQRADQVIE